MPGWNTPDAEERREESTCWKPISTAGKPRRLPGDAAGDSTRHATKGFNSTGDAAKACSGAFSRGATRHAAGRGLVVATLQLTRRFGELSAAQQATLAAATPASWKSGAIGCWMPRHWTRCLATRGTEFPGPRGQANPCRHRNHPVSSLPPWQSRLGRDGRRPCARQRRTTVSGHLAPYPHVARSHPSSRLAASSQWVSSIIRWAMSGRISAVTPRRQAVATTSCRGNQLVVGAPGTRAGTAGGWLTGNRLIIDRSKIARMDSG